MSFILLQSECCCAESARQDNMTSAESDRGQIGTQSEYTIVFRNSKNLDKITEKCEFDSKKSFHEYVQSKNSREMNDIYEKSISIGPPITIQVFN